MRANKNQIKTLLEFRDTALKICELDVNLFMAAICASIDTYAINHDLDRESLFEALADMFYFEDGEPDNGKK